jgi:hypothetical protein
MDKKSNKIIKVSYPIWVLILFTFCGIGSIPILSYYIIWTIEKSLFFSRLWQVLFCSIFIPAIIWFLFKITFYSVSATERGLETANIIGSKKYFQWGEIIEVQTPKFGLPFDISYVISINKGKLLLIRSMKNYKKLIQLIKLKAPNLKRCES